TVRQDVEHREPGPGDPQSGGAQLVRPGRFHRRPPHHLFLNQSKQPVGLSAPKVPQAEGRVARWRSATSNRSPYSSTRSSTASVRNRSELWSAPATTASTSSQPSGVETVA